MSAILSTGFLTSRLDLITGSARGLLESLPTTHPFVDACKHIAFAAATRCRFHPPTSAALHKDYPVIRYRKPLTSTSLTHRRINLRAIAEWFVKSVLPIRSLRSMTSTSFHLYPLAQLLHWEQYEMRADMRKLSILSADMDYSTRPDAKFSIDLI